MTVPPRIREQFTLLLEIIMGSLAIVGTLLLQEWAINR